MAGEKSGENNAGEITAEERVLSGGATAFPRIEPKPAYPPASEIFFKQLLRTIRGPGLAVLAARYLVYPVYKKLATWWIVEKGWSEGTFFAFMSSAAHIVIYIVFNGTFELWDYMQWMQEYKLARKPAQIPSSEQIKAVVKEFILGIPFSFLASIGLYNLYQRRGAPKILDELPSNARMYAHLVFAYYFNMFGFYFAHRFVHSKQLYKIIHKKHHIFVGTVGVAAGMFFFSSILL
jgi:hypothetical protein